MSAHVLLHVLNKFGKRDNLPGISAMAKSWKKLKTSNDFRHLLCVRIEIDQFYCVNC